MRPGIHQPAPFADALDQLGEELRWLDRLLARHVEGLRADGRFNEDPMRGLYIGESEARAALGPSESGDCEWLAELGRATLDARARTSGTLPLAAVTRGFGLDPFERAVLLIAAAPALDRRYQILYAFAQNDVARRSPCVDFALSLLLDRPASRLARLASFAPDATLLRSGVVAFADGDRGKPLAERALVVDDRCVLALLGIPAVDARLAPFTRPVEPWTGADPALEAACDDAFGDEPALVLFEGPLDAGQAQAAAAAAAAEGRGLLRADLDHPAARSAAPAELGRLLAREALLADSALLVSAASAWPDLGIERLLAGAAALGPVLFATVRPGAVSRAALAADLRVSRVTMCRPDALVRARWWRALLPPLRRPHAERLARRTRIGPLAIARLLAVSDPGALDEAAALYADGALPDLAERIEPRWRWDELVLPERQRAQLEALADRLVHWPRVMGEWGFHEKAGCPQNCIALFSGPSGTGKTMAASIVAREAGLPLYRVDLSRIFDKYIGETEKHLDRLFEAAAEASAVLLFDEADALFGKRTQLKDAHDRYANLSVAFLLQRIESYDGLAILATNLPGNMDEAFARRLAFSIPFPPPDEAARRALWAQAFPAAAPLDPDLDLAALAAAFEISGGNVRNIALAAAYLAAADDAPIARRHVLAATGRELEKIGRAPIPTDFGPFQPVR